MDEVHYLADRFRGAVWEEVIIHLPESVSLVSLSATVSNAEEFGEWLETVRGETSTIVEERRPVPLYQHVMVGRQVFDLFADDGADAQVEPRADAGSPATTGEPAVRRTGAASATPSATGPAPGARATRAAAGRPAASTWWSGWTRWVCCRRSCSSSAGSAATPPSPSA